MRPQAPLAWLGIVALALSACAGVLPPIALDGRAFVPEPDEAALWADAAREATLLLERVRPYADAELAAYLLGLAAAPALGTGGPQLRLDIVRDREPNAFAFPDGRLVVHTGLLAAVESPDEIAFILAREIAHVTGRHALSLSRAGAVRPVPLNAGREPLGPVASAIVGQRLALAAMVAIAGYGEAREREADDLAIARLRSAGRDVARAAAVYERLARDSASPQPGQVFALERREWLGQRRDSIARLVTPSASPPAESDEFARRLRPLVRENALENIRDGRHGRLLHAARALDRVLDAEPGDAMAHVYRGDLYRLGAQRMGRGAAAIPRLLGHARSRYLRALELDPTLAEAYRQLGLLHYQAKELAEARAAFERYLALAPNAPDAGRVAGYVRELAR